MTGQDMGYIYWQVRRYASKSKLVCLGNVLVNSKPKNKIVFTITVMFIYFFLHF